MQLAVHGRKQGIEVSETAFDRPFSEPLVHQIVTAYMAGGRSGTKAHKNRSRVTGGGAKPWRQKGTGRARAGSVRSPLWRGGAKSFAAVPRSYEQKVNKKQYRAAMRAILSELNRQERLIVVEDLGIEQPKTRDMAAKLSELGVDGGLLVTAEFDVNLALAARNIPHVAVTDLAELDPVSLVGSEKVVVTVPAVERIQEWLG